jgi:cobalt-zinc-cadmium efflux system outer membrane protein
MQRSLGWLGALLGRDTAPDADTLVTPSVTPLPPALTVGPEHVARHPDVAVARRHALARAAEHDLDLRLRWPDLVAVGGYKRTAGVDTGVAGLTLTLPLFDRNGRTVALSEAERQAAEQRAIEAERRARAEMTATIAEARLLAERAATVASDVMEPAGVARRAARTSFREGAGDVLRLLDAERVFGDAQLQATDVRIEAALAMIRARVVLGEDWP